MKIRFIRVAASLLLLLCVSSIYAADHKVSSQRQDFITGSLQHRGIPYVYGGKTTKGFDCSGFVSYAARTYTNVSLSGSAQNIYDSVEHIESKEREPGDLIFFRTTGGSKISHVGIYLGRYTKSGPYHDKYVFVHAASDGPKTGVIVSAIDEKFWKEHFAGYGRFLPSTKMYNSSHRN